MSQKYFQIYPACPSASQNDKVDLKKRPPWKKIFLHIFSIHSSRIEKRCQMLQTLFLLFQCSKNPQCPPFSPPSLYVLSCCCLSVHCACLHGGVKFWIFFKWWCRYLQVILVLRSFFFLLKICINNSILSVAFLLSKILDFMIFFSQYKGFFLSLQSRMDSVGGRAYILKSA